MIEHGISDQLRRFAEGEVTYILRQPHLTSALM
jgi:hypothetical protein